MSNSSAGRTLTLDLGYRADWQPSTITELDIKRLEKAVRVQLPAPYAQFLIEWDGGTFEECIFHGSAVGSLVVNEFYSIGGKNGARLEVVIPNIREDLPPGSIPFARDP